MEGYENKFDVKITNRTPSKDIYNLLKLTSK